MKLSELIQELKTYQEKLTFDPDISIAEMPGIRIILSDWKLQMRGSNNILGSSAPQTCHAIEKSVLRLQYKHDGVGNYDYRVDIDTHNGFDRQNNHYTLPMNGEYAVTLSYVAENVLDKTIDCAVDIALNKVALGAGAKRFSLKKGQYKSETFSVMPSERLFPCTSRVGDRFEVIHNNSCKFSYLLEIVQI